jgi:hypothetical protein
MEDPLGLGSSRLPPSWGSIHGEDTLISRGPGSARDQIKPRSSGASFEKRVNLASSRAEISRRG